MGYFIDKTLEQPIHVKKVRCFGFHMLSDIFHNIIFRNSLGMSVRSQSFTAFTVCNYDISYFVVHESSEFSFFCFYSSRYFSMFLSNCLNFSASSSVIFIAYVTTVRWILYKFVSMFSSRFS